MFKNIIGIVFALAISCMVYGCATIMQGTIQEIGIVSEPTGATVKINNQLKGTTPIVLDLKRQSSHIITIEMPGYLPYDAIFTKSVSGWAWGNVVFLQAGVIGLLIDFATGGVYKLTPTELRAALQKEGIGSLYRNDALYVAVVLEPHPNWEKIGQLQPID